MVAARTNRDGSEVFRLPEPLSTGALQTPLNAIRMQDEVLYADPVVPPSTLARAQSASAPSEERIEEIVVKLKDEQSQLDAANDRPLADATVRALSQIAGVELRYARPMSGGAHVLQLASALSLSEAQAIASRLHEDSAVEYADVVTRAVPLRVPNDPFYGLQWHYFEPVGGVNLPAAWDVTTGSPNVVVAVVDTGILPDHPDLAGRIVPGYDFIKDPQRANDGDGRDPDPRDPGDWSSPGQCGSSDPGEWSSWHGTHVAGTIGAASNNTLGVAGVNWTSKILPVRVLGRCGGTLVDVADGIRWAAGLAVAGAPTNQNPARVINLSLGSERPCGALYQSAIDDAVAAGAIVVVAAGNAATNVANHAPANCNGVITVVATNREGGRAYYSNFGQLAEVSAPGGDLRPRYDGPYGVLPYDAVLSTSNEGLGAAAAHDYNYKQGTSMAAPHVSGIVSLMLSVNPSLTPSQALALLQSTARPFPFGSTCSTSLCGAGIANAAAAVAAAKPVSPSLGVLENPPPGGAVSGIGLFSGWHCDAKDVRLVVDGTHVIEAAYGTSRNDTRTACGDTDNGFGALFNMAILGDGMHEVVAYADGLEFGRARFRVTTLGEPFVRNASATYTLQHFPALGARTRVRWQEANQNFVIIPAVQDAQPEGASIVASVAKKTDISTEPSATGAGVLEIPHHGSFQSGIGVMSGWHCDASEITIVVDGTTTIRPSYGTSRSDTRGICGDTDNGFGVLFNYANLGAGTHEAVVYADGVEFGRSTFTVTTFGSPFVTGLAGSYLLPDFPAPGTDVVITWQQSAQNFVITERRTRPGDTSSAAFLEQPIDLFE
ncbi:MAG TPA: S8 family peptidase [Candidatus Binatia bacterium]